MIKFNLHYFLKYFYILTIILTLFGSIILINFLYKNFYQTMAQAEQIYLLRSQVALEVIDLKLFEKVIQNLKTKKNPPSVDWENLKNPFLSF